MNTNTLIHLENVTKLFPIYTKKQTKKASKHMDGFDGLNVHHYPALKDVSFSLQQGEWVGIIGRNGSGKSTLLKTIAGVHKPEKGNVKIDGAILPFFGPDEDLHPEGRAQDAVMVKAQQIGLPRSEALKIYENIIMFSELHGFTSQKIKFLSSGMKTRLLLGLMLNINADIYLFDEIPSTTDIRFQRKVMSRLQKLQKLDKTAIIVSHNLDEIRNLCSKTILMHEGEIVAFDETEKILRMYAKI
jgi:ABC-type polysaccharide/polyol phosphate transport system ATPase subunit